MNIIIILCRKDLKNANKHILRYESIQINGKRNEKLLINRPKVCYWNSDLVRKPLKRDAQKIRTIVQMIILNNNSSSHAMPCNDSYSKVVQD